MLMAAGVAEKARSHLRLPASMSDFDAALMLIAHQRARMPAGAGPSKGRKGRRRAGWGHDTMSNDAGLALLLELISSDLVHKHRRGVERVYRLLLKSQESPRPDPGYVLERGLNRDRRRAKNAVRTGTSPNGQALLIPFMQDAVRLKEQVGLALSPIPDWNFPEPDDTHVQRPWHIEIRGVDVSTETTNIRAVIEDHLLRWAKGPQFARALYVCVGGERAFLELDRNGLIQTWE